MPIHRATYRLYAVIMLFCIATVVNAQYKEIMFYDTATLAVYKKNIPVLIQQKDTKNLGAYYKAIADYYYIKSNHDSAINYYTLACKKFEIVRDSFNFFRCHHRIGGYLTFRNAPVKDVMYWLMPAVNYFERNKHYSMAAHTNFDISVAYKNAGMMDERRKYVSKAASLNLLENDTLLSIIIHIGKGVDYRQAGDRTQSLLETKKAVEVAQQSSYLFFQKIALVNLAEDYLYFNDLSAAQNILLQAASLNHSGYNKEITLLNTLLNIKQGNTALAENFFFQFRDITDSILKASRKESLSEQIVRFETEKQLAAIESLKKENVFKHELAQRRSRFIYTLIGGLVLVLSIGWLTINNISKRKNLQLQLQKQEEQFALKLSNEKRETQLAEFNKQLAEVQLTALNAQMNPHFIFNCMNSVQKFILKNEKEKALSFLQSFSELMRNVLDNSAKTKVALDDEINMLQKYVSLEQQRLDYLFDYNIEIDPSLQTDFFEIPGMVIQPYVENAIWHGLMNLQAETRGNGTLNKRKGLLQFAFSRENRYIKCVIEDNGVGRKNATELEKLKSPRRKSFGMALSQKRLELLRLENIEVPEILIEDLKDTNNEPVGTRVTLYINTD